MVDGPYRRVDETAMKMSDLNDVLASRYEVDVYADPLIGPWVAHVFVVTKTTRQLLASFGAVDEATARDAAYEFLKDRPR